MSLKDLLDTPIDARDEKWEDNFLQSLSTAKLSLLSPDPQTGPDGWPYLLVQTISHENSSVSQAEDAQKIFQWLGTRGIGVAINPQKEYPDFVLSWGMIWNFRETGKFIDRQAEQQVQSSQIDFKNIVHAGTPTPQYLPDYVRKIVREFFRDQGILSPKILVISSDRKNYDLAFSVESLGNPPESEWTGIAEAISWFLPAHYSIVLISEKTLPNFTEL